MFWIMQQGMLATQWRNTWWGLLIPWRKNWCLFWWTCEVKTKKLITETLQLTGSQLLTGEDCVTSKTLHTRCFMLWRRNCEIYLWWLLRQTGQLPCQKWTCCFQYQDCKLGPRTRGGSCRCVAACGTLDSSPWILIHSCINGTVQAEIQEKPLAIQGT